MLNSYSDAKSSYITCGRRCDAEGGGLARACREVETRQAVAAAGRGDKSRSIEHRANHGRPRHLDGVNIFSAVNKSVDAIEPFLASNLLTTSMSRK